MSNCIYCGASTFGRVCAECSKEKTFVKNAPRAKEYTITQAIDYLYQRGFDIYIETFRGSGVSNLLNVRVMKANLVVWSDNGHLPGLREEVLRATLNNAVNYIDKKFPI